MVSANWILEKLPECKMFVRLGEDLQKENLCSGLFRFRFWYLFLARHTSEINPQPTRNERSKNYPEAFNHLNVKVIHSEKNPTYNNGNCVGVKNNIIWHSFLRLYQRYYHLRCVSGDHWDYIVNIGLVSKVFSKFHFTKYV